MVQPYKIVIIAGQLVVGGAEKQLFLWLSNLDRSKFDPVVVTLHPGYNDYWENEIVALGIPILCVPRRHNRFLRAFDIVEKLRPFRPQLIHGWHLFSSPYAGLVAKILGTKSLGSLRTSFDTFQKNSLEASLTFYLTDAILANSKSAAEQLFIAKKRQSQKIYCVPNAVDALSSERFVTRDVLSSRFGISLDDVLIGSLGRLDPKKHFPSLLQVMALLQEHTRNVHFLLIGDGPERQKLETMATELGISNHVTFTGEVPGASAWLSALDIFCFTSLDEGLPNVVLEAAMAGVPVVAWRLPFIEEIITDGETGLLVEPNNLDDFRDAILSLLHNPSLGVALGVTGRKHVQKEFSLDKFIYRMSLTYDHLLGVQHEVGID